MPVPAACLPPTARNTHSRQEVQYSRYPSYLGANTTARITRYRRIPRSKHRVPPVESMSDHPVPRPAPSADGLRTPVVSPGAHPPTRHGAAAPPETPQRGLVSPVMPPRDAPAAEHGTIPLRIRVPTTPTSPTPLRPVAEAGAPRRPRAAETGPPLRSPPTSPCPPRPAKRLAVCLFHGFPAPGCAACMARVLDERPLPGPTLGLPPPPAVGGAAVQPLCYCELCGPGNCMTCRLREELRAALGGSRWV